MKKALVLILSLCLLCSVAFAEETIALNWEDIATEEVAAQGEFQQIAIPDVATVVYWIPSVMNSVDVSQIEGEFKPAALFTTEDESYSVAVFAFQVTSVDEYVAQMESQGGGSSFHNVTINGVDCVSYEVADADIDSLVYPVTDTMVLSFNCTPLNGDEDWDAVKAVIFSSIQPVE